MKKRLDTPQFAYPKGSEWRKWDLHIHSNASDGSLSCEVIVQQAKKKDLSVIALTDHHTTKNIDKIREIGKAKGLAVIAGIEFRTEYGDKSVHMIGLFPEVHGEYELDGKNLEDLVLNQLGLSEAKMIAAGNRELEKKSKGNPSAEEARKQGMFLVQVDFKTAANLIHKYGGLVVAHAGSKENSFDREMKHLGKPGVTLANSLGPVKEELLSSGYIDICEIRKENDNAEFYLNNFDKPSITASDAHELEDIGSRFAWIKADPCFEGLRSIVHEPKSRVCLSDRPEVLERVRQNGTKYISNLAISAIPQYDGRNGQWFKNVSMDFGNELTVIIGNKGSGKSAITDIMGLCGHSRYYPHFSFLKQDRFLENGYADKFTACLQWVSPEKKSSKCLCEPVDLTSPEDVKYLPQGYFERVCNEIANLDEFKREINSVVFQHIPEEKRLKKETFDDFLDFKRTSIERVVASKKQTLHELNHQIAQLEKKRNPVYHEELNKQRQAKQDELDALPVPKKVAAPSKASTKDPNAKAAISEIRSLTTAASRLKRQIAGVQTRIQRQNGQLETLRQFLRELVQKKQDLDEFVLSFASRLKALKNFEIGKVISYRIDTGPIRRLIDDLKAAVTNESNRVSEESVKGISGEELSLVVQLEEKERDIKRLQSKLDEPNRKYEDYRKAFKTWKDKAAKLRGSATTIGTLKYFDAQTDYFEKGLYRDIARKRKDRSHIVREIYSARMEILEIYAQLKQFIDQVIERNQDKVEKYEINILAEFGLAEEFIPNLLGYIYKNVVGTYRGAEAAENTLLSMIHKVNPNDLDSIMPFLDRVILSLERDERLELMEPRFIDDQVEDMDGLYDYLFSLDYIEANYELKLGNKKLEKLSPGEKGALLIVFYLLLDKSDKPLILDQPEDNLDNESVSKILVPFLKEARKRRQIIMVTHNPNLAVYADAEQVIRVDIDKNGANLFHFCSGGIDNLAIKEHIVNVLEGTMPAFANRSRKYSEK
ncbi:MAG: TrlF family AAA-like ATPase [Spirochaetia bacterium]|jgi:energy-coupling factor transporter ATP-binding protein EcfA2